MRAKGEVTSARRSWRHDHEDGSDNGLDSDSRSALRRPPDPVRAEHRGLAVRKVRHHGGLVLGHLGRVVLVRHGTARNRTAGGRPAGRGNREVEGRRGWPSRSNRARRDALALALTHRTSWTYKSTNFA